MSSPHSEKASLDMTAPTLTSRSQGSPASTIVDDKHPQEKKSLRFWLIFVALCMATFLSALDLTAVSTALPDIAAAFHTSDYSWVGSAYALTSTALIPCTGGLAAIFGRRPVMLGALVLFALGSALAGAAQNMSMMLAGRSIPGIGGGAILTMTEIVITDLVPLAERGAYFGIIGAVWALASAIGPPIGGALASGGAWRWLFYLNLPLTGIAIVLVALFLRVKAPQTTTMEKLEQMDYANLIFVAASTATVLGLTWGGVTYSWSSYKVLVPLILGLAGIAAFLYVEKRFVKYPTVPFDILTHRTSLLGYATTFLHSIIVLAIIYFLPVYFQATKGASAIRSGIDLFPVSFIVAPFAIVVGISVTITGHYKIQNHIGWAFLTLGMGLMTIPKWDSSTVMWVFFTMIPSIGAGLLRDQLPRPCPTQARSAASRRTFRLVSPPLLPRLTRFPLQMAFYGFVRSFGQVFVIAIGSTVLQNQLAKKLPADFAAQFGEGEIAFAAIPYIKGLAEPLRTLARAAFADSLRTIWQVCIGVAGLGFLLSLGIQQMSLATETDQENWGLKEKEREKEVIGV
ncbi:hypothetical protein JCM8097_004910 [Rhodosporidiobolus ruineniae]